MMSCEAEAGRERVEWWECCRRRIERAEMGVIGRLLQAAGHELM